MSETLFVGLVFAAFFTFILIGIARQPHKGQSPPTRASMPPDGVWYTSENGNQTMVRDGERITVFGGDGRWSYCLAVGDNDRDPYFSDDFETFAEAKRAALEDLNSV